MRKTLIAAALAAASLTIPPSQALAEDAAAAQAAHYSVTTTPIGKLIDNPSAAAILKELIPTVWANEMFHSLGRDQTLKGIQQFEPVLTDEKLAEIQDAFDDLPVKG
jgi:hypothetical protein